MKMLARSYVYWPSLDADIESLVKNCTRCAMVAKKPVKAGLYSFPKPTAPWTRIHADFTGLLHESTISSSWTHSQNGPKS
ncbi:hypothetical protein Y032_0250g154 [Ancylostoma ceylanicum]|uniref:RNA-directed DNA polymerase n=1 Tax=Ancylostoma ceylanicum TaxID=53326 RepID=A0A016SCA1_9BILA|nr:hypothetical protein Y032_0250g154 [Ancylostoma ceylanicum]